MLDILASSPLLTIMVVVSLGTLLGIVPFGPVKLGPAGALFVGLFVGALDPRLGQNHANVQSLGLALFVYTVGIASGAAFFRSVRRQLPLMLGSVLVLCVCAAFVMTIGALAGLPSGLRGGVFAGALTSTPSLAAAAAKTGTQEPAVGYAITYPLGVVLSIVAVAFLASRRWNSPKDPEPITGQALIDFTLEVKRSAKMCDVPGFADHLVRFSYLARNDRVRVVTMDEEFQPGDRVVIIGPDQPCKQALEFLGEKIPEHLAQDRSKVDFRRILISNPHIAGHTVGELEIPERFHGIVTRVRRGDVDLLAHDNLTVELGDRIRVCVPRSQMEAVNQYLGDSERRVSQIDALSLGIGLTIGLLVGLIAIPLPGGLKLSLGAAAGPLLVGMALGRIERTGPIVWGLPNSANLTIRQLGLLLFLATTGLASGQAFSSQAFSLDGLKILLFGAVLTAMACVMLIVMAKFLGAGPARIAGAIAGFISQPAILAYANERVVDERVNSGYSALFALGMITKILLVQVIVGL